MLDISDMLDIVDIVDIVPVESALLVPEPQRVQELVHHHAVLHAPRPQRQQLQTALQIFFMNGIYFSN